MSLIPPETASEIDTEGFFGSHMTTPELDAEFLSRIEPTKLKDLAAFQGMAWFGYRFMSPGLRVFLFIDSYRNSYRRNSRLLGQRWSTPAWLKSNPLAEARKGDVTALVTATLTADSMGVPYDIWCDNMMELSLRVERPRPLQPPQLYQAKMISHVLDCWKDRNEHGIYLARIPEFDVSNYEGHPWQDAYQNWLCDKVERKGNRAFWVGRLMYGAKQLTPEIATARFGAEIVDDARIYT